MRVALDARKLDDFGIGTYLRGLLGELTAGEVPEELVVYLPPATSPPRAAARPGVRWQPERARPYSAAELWRLALDARRDRAEVFHAPHYVCPPVLPCPAVVTVHDLIHLRFGPRRARGLGRLYAGVMLRLAVQRAARLIAVSESTRRDLLTRLGAAPERVRVIPNGVAAHFRPAAEDADLDGPLAALGVARPYLLFIGNPLPHKNLPRLLDAVAGLPAEVGRLVIAGVRPAMRSAVEAACAARGLGGRVTILAPLPAETLPLLYQGATLLACPSLWEGFGLPALEAMACGTPVVAANRGALPEVVGDAAVLVDPVNVDALRDALYNVAVRAPVRAVLRAAGLVRARAFSWRQAAEATVAVYREAVAGADRR